MTTMWSNFVKYGNPTPDMKVGETLSQKNDFETLLDFQILLGVPSNLKISSECNFRPLWGGGGGHGDIEERL